MANEMKHGVSCSIYIPDAVWSTKQWYHTSRREANKELNAAIDSLPGSTITRGIGSWQGITEPVQIVTCVVDSYGEVADIFRAIADELKGRGEQQVLITVSPISYILE